MLKSLAVVAVLCGVSAAQSIPTLHPDTPVRQSVAADTCNRYLIDNAGSPGSFNLSVTVSPLQGDADIYMNCGDHMPSKSHYIWRSIHFGEDSVDVFQDDPNFCSSHFVLAVCGFTNATYVVEADIHKGKKAFAWLMDGVPISDRVEQGESLYYAVNVPKDASDAMKSALLDVVLSPYSGDPDLFIGCSPYPTARSANWASWSRQVDAIAINRTDPHQCASGTYYITVYGFEAAEFGLAATVPTGRAQYLFDRHPVRDVVYQNQYTYYKFRPNLGGSSQNVTVRVQAEDDPSFDADLYIDCGQAPSRSNHKWMSAHGGGLEDKVVIPDSDQHSCVHTGEPFMIAVYGFRYSVYRVEAYVGSLRPAVHTALRGPLSVAA